MESLYQRVVNNIKTKLHEPYQVDGCKWMLSRELDNEPFFDEFPSKGGILADEVGLGKTLMSICVIIGNPVPKTLIILPKSIVNQWKQQITKFTNMRNIVFVDKSLTSISQDGVYLMSNSLLNSKNKNVGETIVHNVYWDRIIIDEAHLLRNEKSKIHQSVCLLESNIKWALTATPVMNRMTDFVHIMKWFNISRFLCQSEKMSVTNKFILRRTKEDVCLYNKNLKLPDCKIDVEYIPFKTIKEADLYTKVFLQERKKLTNEKNKTVTDLLEHLLRIRQLCIHPQLYYEGMKKKTGLSHGEWTGEVTKVSILLKYLKSHKQEKSLIFCQFKREMDIYEQVLSNEGYNVVRLDGSMNLDDRNVAIEKFKRLSNINIFLIQINTGGQGINLQVASRIYIMSPSWNPAIEYQAIGRAHRTGQQKKVHVKKFVITSNDPNLPFVEENMMKLQDVKKEIIADTFNDQRIMNDGTNIHRNLDGDVSVDDIRNLFNLTKLQHNQ